MSGIKWKMVINNCILTILVCISLSAISFYVSSNTLRNETSNGIKGVANSGSKIMESKLQEKLTAISVIANNDIIKSEVPFEEKKDIIVQEKKRGGYVDIAVIDKNGIGKTSGEITMDISDRDYFKKAISGQNAVSEPLISKADGSLIIVFAVPIKENENIKGVVISSISTEELLNITKEVTYGNSSSIFIIGKDGTAVANENIDLVKSKDNIFENVKKDSQLQALADIQTKMVNGESGVGLYEYKDVKKFLGYAPIKIADWSIGVTAPEKEVFKGIYNMVRINVAVAILMILISSLIIYYISKRMAEPMEKYSQILNIFAKGDFTPEISEKYLRRKDELGVIGNSINLMKNSISELIKEIINDSHKMTAESQELSAVIEELTVNSEDIQKAEVLHQYYTICESVENKCFPRCMLIYI